VGTSLDKPRQSEIITAKNPPIILPLAGKALEQNLFGFSKT